MSEQRITQILENSHDKVNGGIDVNIQSQTSQLFQYMLINEIKTDITLTAEIEVDDTVISVSAGHGFTGAASEIIVVRSGNIFLQMNVVSVSTNDITVEMPIDNAFPLTSTVIRGSSEMAVDGSSTPVTFKYSMGNATIPIDLSTVVITFTSGATVPDDGTFGGIAAITNGMYFRKENGSQLNLGNYRINQEFKDVGAIVNYTEKAPAGTNGTDITIEFEKVFGQVIRLDPSLDDTIIAVVRDDIDALASMRISLIGSFTSGE